MLSFHDYMNYINLYSTDKINIYLQNDTEKKRKSIIKFIHFQYIIRWPVFVVWIIFWPEPNDLTLLDFTPIKVLSMIAFDLFPIIIFYFVLYCVYNSIVGNRLNAYVECMKAEKKADKADKVARKIAKKAAKKALYKPEE